MHIYLHVGAGKCGSSSIQRHFSENNIIERFAYGALRVDGKIIEGDAVKRRARLSESNYAASYTFNQLIDKKFSDNLKNSLSILSKRYDSLLLSSEAWMNKNEIFSNLDSVFSDYQVTVIVVIRPPVKWYNSAWWQWGVWESDSVERWVNNRKVVCPEQWGDCVQAYSEISFVSSIHVLNLEGDLIQSLCNILHINNSPTVTDIKHNTGSSFELLSFMKQNRVLRPRPHDSRNEFVLNKYLKARSKAPWVLSEFLIEDILRRNERNYKLLSDYSSDLDFLQQRSWWDKGYYDKHQCSNLSLELDVETISSMLEEAYSIIISLDKKNKRLNEYLTKQL